MPERALPREVLDMHVGILGKTGSGKSNLAKATVERLDDEGARYCVIDPTGTWYGLRLTPARKPSKYQPVIFGGQHADIPIGRTHGAAVAETIGTTSTSAIIDTRTMTVGERTDFFIGFGETLLQKNQGPLHLVIDEAHLFAPQGRVADPKSGAMVHAANNLVSLGRGIGLRIILISQRPAKLHKDSLTQIETLIAMRLIAPQDRHAIDDWIGEWAEPAQGKELVQSLPSLKTGEYWIWAPELGLLERRTAPLASTLDTGKPSAAPIELGSINVDDVKARLSQVAKDVLDNDPRALRQRIRELEAEARGGTPVEKIVEKLVYVDRLAVQTQQEIDAHLDALRKLYVGGEQIVQQVRAILEREQHGRSVRGPSKTKTEVRALPPAPTTAPATGRPAARPPVEGEAPLKQAERSILAALAPYPQGRSKVQVALLSGYSSTSGGFFGALAALRRYGFIDGDAKSIRITSTGHEVLGPYDPLPAGQQLLEYWYGRLNPAESNVLRQLVDSWPETMSKTDVAAAAGYSATSGGFFGALAKLRKLDLIEGTGSALRATDEIAEHRS